MTQQRDEGCNARHEVFALGQLLGPYRVACRNNRQRRFSWLRKFSRLAAHHNAGILFDSNEIG